MSKIVTFLRENEKNIEITITNLLICTCTCLVFKYLPNSRLILLVGIIVLLINCLRYFFEEKLLSLIDFIIQYRWIIAIIIFILCMVLRLHGSSIGVYDQIFGSLSGNTEIFGQARPIRSDEFLVQLPYYFSQQFNEYNKISYQMSLAGQDMIIGYNAPVLDLTLIGKPFVWGYILLGNELGLSWYWCSKLILCILVCFEMFKIITKNDYISLFGSLLLVFSPVMQWWFSPHMYDVFFWGMTLFVVGYYFFMAKRTKNKILFTLLAGCSLVGFAIALFPSLQIPTGLFMLALMIGCLIRDKKDFEFKKIDLLRVLAVIVIVGIVLGQFLITSFEDIKLLSNTVYPGKQNNVGGNFKFSDLFTSLNMIITPFKDPSISNACELSTFNHLGVLSILIFPYLIYITKLKKGNTNNLIIGIIIFIIILIEIIFMLFGFPEMLARITLFSYINRMHIAYGFTATIFTIWTICYLYENWNLCSIKMLLLISILFGLLYLLTIPNMIDPLYVQFLTKYFYCFGVIAIAIFSFFVLFKIKRIVLALSCAWIFMTSFTVNPIVTGISMATDYDFINVAKNHMINNEGYWLGLDSLHTQQLLLANGFKVLNAVNFYPDYSKWEIIDSNDENQDVYNRYAHMSVSLINGSTEFKVNQPDSIAINLDVSKLKDLGVRYLCSFNDYSQVFKQAGIVYEEFYNDKGIRLYKVY